MTTRACVFFPAFASGEALELTALIAEKEPTPALSQCDAKDSFTSSWWADGGRRLRNEIDRNGSYELDRDQGTISAGVGASSCFSPSGGAHTHIALSEVCVTLRPRTTSHFDTSLTPLADMRGRGEGAGVLR